MRAWLEIDLDVVARNYDLVQQHIGGAGIFAVVKSDAYGHGLEAIVRTLHAKGIAGFAVIELDEAIRVRALSDRPVLILGYVADDEIEEAVRRGCHLSLYDFELAAIYNAAAAKVGVPLTVHLKVETGLNRLGMQAEEAERLVLNLSDFPFLRVAGVYSHLAMSGNKDSNFSQLARFHAVREKIRSIEVPSSHLANSGALQNIGAEFFDFVRVGLALYGVEPVLDGLQPSLQCKTVVIQRKRLPKGEGVSYNHLFVAPRDMDIAVIAIGYAEGLTQALTGKARVLVHGRNTPIIGQICMNLCVIDATGLPVQRGDEVVVVGRQGAEEIRITQLAQAAGLRHHEIITRFGRALPRVYRGA